MVSRNKRKLYEGTTVEIGKTQSQIRALLLSHGAASFGIMESSEAQSIAFELLGRRMMFRVATDPNEREMRRRWRVIRQAIKIRLEEVTSGDLSVDDAFMPFIILPHGHTVSESVAPLIEKSYLTGKLPGFLLEYRG